MPARTLLVLRHAKSSWADASLDDHERPLNGRGRRDAPRMGDLLRERRLLPDLVITSDAVRARTTAEMVTEAADYHGPLHVEPALYLATPDQIIAVLRALGADPARRVMIVGHNPGLEDLIEELTGEPQAMPTAALAQLALPIPRWGDLSTSTAATLVDLWRPKELE